MKHATGTSVLAARLEGISEALGRAVSWMTLAMVLITFAVVVLRYLFGTGVIWLQESITWLHAVVFMMGAAYTLKQEEHVRVDIFYREMSPQRRAWVNIAGLVLFLWPMCIYLCVEAFDYVRVSWQLREGSREAGGLPYPFVPVLKSVILLMPVTISLQGVAILLRALVDLREN
jgi:TRAP-type mannitol/chloroaromatic compound transport system permease small subunit